jgi:glyoxylase-like metal-dependent hydrolase (beta-lactamase superfamily II)
MLSAVPPSTVIAPGHGPLTTVENELRFNPFAP